MTKTKLYHDLHAACRQPGCPVCTVVQDGVARYLDAIFYEQVNDIPLRKKLRDARGLCNDHAWIAADVLRGNALGLAIVYNDVMKTVLEELANQTPRRRVTLKVSGTCPACAWRDEITVDAISVMAEYIKDPDLLAEFKKSNGLCLFHLKAIFEKINDVESREVLLSLQKGRWQSLQLELEEFIRKNDYRFQKEGFGDERDSWRRAVWSIAGNNIKKQDQN
jgi:hypothetical protein